MAEKERRSEAQKTIFASIFCKNMAISKKKQALFQFGLLVGILFFVNVLAQFFYGHLDLTEEKRFTLTKPTKALLRDLKDVVNVKVLLEGEFPAGFKRLQNSTRELLDDLRGESGFLEYQFEDPNSGTVDQINSFRKNLAEQNIFPVRLDIKDQAGKKEQFVYPVAIFSYGDRSITVNLLESENPASSPQEVLNNSITLLEYKFANAIQKLQMSLKTPILFTKGHGELSAEQLGDLDRSLNLFYHTGLLHLDSVTSISPEVGAVVVAKPRTAFSEKDKFKLDQYAMQGGKILWLIDRMGVSLDSIGKAGGRFVPNDLPINLEDILYKYGARIQPNLILDMQCTKIPLAVGQVGGQPQYEMFPWFYHPAVAPMADHPLVKNLDRVAMYFPSTIDTIKTKTSVKKTVLLTSSKYSRVQFSPVDLNFEILRLPEDATKFNKGPQPVAVLLEGIFPSNFENRVGSEMAETLQKMGQTFRKESLPTRQIVVSDGDLAASQFNLRDKKWEPLGVNVFEKFQGQVYPYANKAFLLNCIEYLLEPHGVIEARAKEVKLRLLDRQKAEAEKGFWQGLNLGLPLLFLAVFGWAFSFFRKRKYARTTA